VVGATVHAHDSVVVLRPDRARRPNTWRPGPAVTLAPCREHGQAFPSTVQPIRPLLL
jgi:hypothetical protein